MKDINKGFSDIYKIEYFGFILSLLILAVAAYRIQVISMGIPLVISFYFLCKNLYDIKKLKIVWPLVCLLILGTRIGLGYPIIHVLRDYAYFLSPITAFAMGYFLQKYLDKERYILLMILFGSLYSIVYFIQVIYDFDTLFVLDAIDVRYSIGTGTPTPILALVLILFGSSYLKDFKIASYYLILFFINLLAIYYFASRVYYFTLFLFFLPLLYTSFMKKYRVFGKYLFIVVFGLLLCIIFFLFKGDGMLAEKMRNSLTEMFMQSFEDYDSVIQNWRAYELFEVVNTFMNASWFNKLFGFGFGKTIYLEFELIMPLLTISEIPIFHNGFAYLLVKTGLLGIFLELLFSFVLLYKGYVAFKSNPEAKFEFCILCSCVLSFNFSLLVVNGFFSGESVQLIIMASYMFYRLQSKVNHSYENKYNNSYI